MATVTVQELRDRLDGLARISFLNLTLEGAAHFLDVSRERMRQMVKRNQVEGGGPPRAKEWYVEKKSVEMRVRVRLEILEEEEAEA